MQATLKVIVEPVVTPNLENENAHIEKKAKHDDLPNGTEYSLIVPIEVAQALNDRICNDGAVHLKLDPEEIGLVLNGLQSILPVDETNLIATLRIFYQEIKIIYIVNKIFDKVLEWNTNNLLTLHMADSLFRICCDQDYQSNDVVPEAVKNACCQILFKFVHDLDQKESYENFLSLNSWWSIVRILTYRETAVYYENTEKKVFQLVRQWILKDKKRESNASKVLNAVRYSTLTPEYLLCVVSGNTILTCLNDSDSGQITALLAHAMYYIQSSEEIKKTLRDALSPADYRKIYHIARPYKAKPSVEFCWETKIPTSSEFELRSSSFLIHGIFAYMNIRLEKNKPNFIAITLHIQTKETGIRYPNHIQFPMHYYLYIMDQVTEEYVSVGLVDHIWARENGWGKSLKIPDHPFVIDGVIKVKVQAYIGRAPTPLKKN